VISTFVSMLLFLFNGVAVFICLVVFVLSTSLGLFICMN
jgi:hypothetical protein